MIPLLRSLVWRVGRKLYCAARGELGNDPRTNGEYWLLNQVQFGQQALNVLIDIGANKGNWSFEAASAMRKRGLSGRIYAFEPASSTSRYLKRRFEHEPSVEVRQLAVSDSTGKAQFYVTEELGGTNSLFLVRDATSETVNTIRFDEFMSAEGLTRVSFVKSDTEGNDFSVLQGAKKSLSFGLIDLWQFEYNHRWTMRRAILRDVFQLISSTPYRLGRLLPASIELYDEWHPELERFFEANYVLVRRGSPYDSLCSRLRFNKSNVPVPV